MSGSPCPTCRNPMRWIPAMQQWGCDTCRVTYPAQPVVQNFAMAMQPKKSSKGLVIGVSLLAIAGAGAAITLIAMQAKKAPAAAATTGSDGSAATGGSGSAVASGSGTAPIPKQPIATPPTSPPVPRDLSLGKPEPMELADLWLTPRKDGAFVVTSPLFEVVFPHRPRAKLEPGAHEAYVLSDDLAGRGLLSLQITPGGDGVDKSMAAKLGPVIESHATDRGLAITRFEASSVATGETARIEVRDDAAHRLHFVATASFIASDQATAKEFLDSLHARTAPDPADDPKSLTVRVRKEHGKNEVHDAGDSFVIALPWATKISRVAASRPVAVTATATRGKASATLAIEELSAWEALAFSPARQQAFVDAAKTALAQTTKLDVKVAAEKLGGLPASRLDAKGHGHSYHTHVVWNRFQHRRYTLACVDAPCDVIALSLKLAAPIPTP